MKLFEESDFENLGDLERLKKVLDALNVGKLIRRLYRIRGKYSTMSTIKRKNRHFTGDSHMFEL